MNRSKMPSKTTRIVQIGNICLSATREQLYTMLSYLGRISELKVFPSETNPLFSQYDRKLCYVRYEDSACAQTAQHLTNTVLIDKAIVVVPYYKESIPDENSALQMGAPTLPSQRSMPCHCTNKIELLDGKHMIFTDDPELSAHNLPPYPPLNSNTDATVLEEIRRTVYVGNLPKEAKPEEIVDMLNEKIGEVMYLRMAGDESLPQQFAYIEFAQQRSVVSSLMHNGMVWRDCELRIQHSNQAIDKPRAKTDEDAQREMEAALDRVGMDPAAAPSSSARDSSSSRHVDDDRRSRERREERRSSRERRRTRSPVRRRPSREKRRSRSKERSTRRSRSKDRRRRSKSREASRRTKRSRSKERSRRSSKDRSKRDSKERKREKSRERRRSGSKGKSRKRSPDKSDDKAKAKKRRSKSKEREKPREKKVDSDDEKKVDADVEVKKESSKSKSKSPSPQKSRSNSKSQDREIKATAD